ncbi:hypothetical protein G3480_21150 [Thiorhodococcus mannitoliphagus]|uniref:Uncharacterized protein n=1 Tax=Thiorhodococcus mannitoliphagus TaxID=329406 RepID=A0A6P1DYM2_9GAMM|nr:hypothetical protein [Thiorhodococcus mannitoliphagus]NEX22779.1 hypothetical protein [Thiorhodococcus mannitoliphagus]
MPRPKPNDLSSRELLARIGLSDDAPTDLLDDEPLEDLRGDLGAALRERYRSLVQRHSFAPGDLVSWKPGLRNKRIPRYDQPAVVIEVLDEPVLDRMDEAGSTYFREPLDLVLGLIWDSNPGRGELVTFHYDSRRFQPWSEAE